MWQSFKKISLDSTEKVCLAKKLYVKYNGLSGAVLHCRRGGNVPQIQLLPQIQKLAVDLKCCLYGVHMFFGFREWIKWTTKSILRNRKL